MQNEKKYLDLANYYFKIFSEKNLEMLGQIFHDQVTLRDWNFKGEGKSEVLKINREIFENNSKIYVMPLKKWIVMDKDLKGATLFADLKIDDKKGNSSLVLDILTFREDKITSITAYKGN